MDKLLRDEGAAPRQISIPTHGSGPSAPLMEVLWRRRWTLALTVFACVAAAAIYLYAATPIYLSISKIAISQNGPKPFGDTQGFVSQSDSYMQTQADIFQSTSVLARALDAVHYRSFKSFSRMTGDPVAWLREFKGFKVDVARKSDVIVVSMESPYPREAAAFVNSVINAYIEEQSRDKRYTGSEMVKVLQHQKQDLQQRRDACLSQMVDYKRQSGVLSLKEDKGNTAMERAEALASAETTANMATMEARAQRDAIKAALATPESIAAFVEAQQSKGRDSGDPEYQELRSQLTQLTLTQSTGNTIQGPNHPRVQILQSVVDALKTRIANKQRSMVESQLAAAESNLSVAESRERQLGSTYAKQQDRVGGLGMKMVEYTKLEAEASRLQKQIDLLDGRTDEISVNNMDVAPLNIKVLEQARAEENPVKPNKMLVMAAAMMVGLMLGMGLSIVREWKDARLRSPEEILAVLGTPVLATVPRINLRLSPVNRGQMVRLDSRSVVAEAYRSVRTSLCLGIAGKAKSILVASPMPGDGKSTTASNLAIAFAQAGERTLLIDCDFREPVQHLIFETAGNVGLTSVMTGETKLRDAIRPTRASNLFILPCGPVPSNPSELLGSKRFGRVIAALSKTFDRIIIDSSPLLRFSDGRILAASADATILVLRMNQSMRTLGVMAVNGLEKVGANLLGAVANDVPSGSAYPYYGGSSQFIPRPRAMPMRVEVKAHGKNGDALNAPRPMDRIATEALAIAEPDWAADSH
jgi:capsular exopolysaccharide synthesis family protein